MNKKLHQDGGNGDRDGGVTTYKSLDLTFDEMFRRSVNGITSFLTGSDVSNLCNGLPGLARQDIPFGAFMERVLFINYPRYWRLALSTIHEHAHKFSVLRTLNLCRTYSFGDAGMEVFAGIFTTHPKALPQLKKLVLCHCDIGVAGLVVFARIFIAYPNALPQLQTLDLGMNCFFGHPNTLPLPQLQTLNLCCNDIGDKGATALIASLRHVTGLQMLNLGFCCRLIGVEAIKALVSSLRHVTGLRTLDLSNNRFGVESATALAASLRHMIGLQTLDLSDNRFGDEGATALAESLQHVKELQTLNLMSNEIGDKGARALATSLSHVIGLQTLNLLNNNIGDEGTGHLPRPSDPVLLCI